MLAIIPLAAMRPGECGEVVDVCGEECLVNRLCERGLRKGCRLEALSIGDPWLLKVDETRMSLRVEGKVEVFVQI